MKKVLVPIDFDDNPGPLINYSIGFSQQFKCKLLFFHSVLVLTPTTIKQSEYQDKAEYELKKMEDLLIKKVLQSCQRMQVDLSKLHFDYRVKLGGNVIHEILQISYEESVDRSLPV